MDNERQLNKLVLMELSRTCQEQQKFFFVWTKKIQSLRKKSWLDWIIGMTPNLMIIFKCVGRKKNLELMFDASSRSIDKFFMTQSYAGLPGPSFVFC